MCLFPVLTYKNQYPRELLYYRKIKNILLFNSLFHVKCSGQCGRGIQYRNVQCTIYKPKLNNMLVLESSKCTGNVKPEAIRRCKNEKPCRVRYYVSRWGAVSSILILEHLLVLTIWKVFSLLL